MSLSKYFPAGQVDLFRCRAELAASLFPDLDRTRISNERYRYVKSNNRQVARGGIIPMMNVSTRDHDPPRTKSLAITFISKFPTGPRETNYQVK